MKVAIIGSRAFIWSNFTIECIAFEVGNNVQLKET